MVRRHEIDDSCTDEFPRYPAEQFHRTGRDPLDHPLGTDSHDHVGAVLGNEPIPFLGLLECFAGRHGIGDIGDLRDEVLDGAGVLTHAGHGKVSPHHRPVGSQVSLEQSVGVPLPRDDGCHQGLIGVQVIGVSEFLPTGHQQVGLIAAEHGAQRRVDLKESPVRGHDRHTDR